MVDASGRAGRFAAAYRAQVEGGDCGVAYASRLFQLRPGADPGPINGGPGWMADYDGLLNIIFVHDAGTFSVLLVRLGTDRELTALRDETAYTTALSLLPAAAEWSYLARAFPIDKVRAGAGLVNLYRPQTRDVTGLLAIGDAVCTTNPTGGRGVSLAIRAAAELADLVATHPPDSGRRGWTPGRSNSCGPGSRSIRSSTARCRPGGAVSRWTRTRTSPGTWSPRPPRNVPTSCRPSLPFLAMLSLPRPSTRSATRSGPCCATAGALRHHPDLPATTSSRRSQARCPRWCPDPQR